MNLVTHKRFEIFQRYLKSFLRGQNTKTVALVKQQGQLTNALMKMLKCIRDSLILVLL